MAHRKRKYKAQRKSVGGQWHGQFLIELARIGNIGDACRIVDVSLSAVYDARDNDPSFGMAMKIALEEACMCNLEAEAFRRAVTGIDVPITYQGQPVFVWVNEAGEIVEPPAPGAPLDVVMGLRKKMFTKKEYSDALLSKLLAGANPAKYGTVRQEHTGAGGEPLRIISGLSSVKPEDV